MGTLENSTVVEGRFGGDLELKKSGEHLYVRVSLAIRQFERNEEGRRVETQDNPLWLPVVFFGRTAEYAARAFQKGDKVRISGRLQGSVYSGAENERPVQSISLVADELVRAWPRTSVVDDAGPQFISDEDAGRGDETAESA